MDCILRNVETSAPGIRPSLSPAYSEESAINSSITSLISQRYEGRRTAQFRQIATTAAVTVAALTVFASSPKTSSGNNFSISSQQKTSASLPTEKVLAEHMISAKAEMHSYEALTDGWDGQGSIAPDPSSIDTALEFIDALPFDIFPPEAGATPDGDVEWYWKTKNGVATVSISGRKISYYVRTRSGHVQGTQALVGQSVPHKLLSSLRLL